MKINCVKFRPSCDQTIRENSIPTRSATARSGTIAADKTLTRTRITDQDEAADLLPAFLGRRLIGQHGRFGLLLTTGEVMRITSIGAFYMSSNGLVLLDVSLDQAGVPDDIGVA